MREVGILTFHCADNYGGILQAYGLKRYLTRKGLKAHIIPYEPPFMTGRHWWIPYVPSGNVLRIFGWGLFGWTCNLKKGRSFFVRRASMRRFRKRYLVEKGQKKIFFTYQLRRLPYQYYIVGSDQIWNPKITCGLRAAYFGAFPNRNKVKVISYAASLGSRSLPTEYEKEFSKLIKHVDAVSVREEAAIPCIRQLYSGEVLMVPDPVFLLKRKEWEKIERLPDREGYIVVFITEKNDELFEYAKELSKSRGLPVVEIESGINILDEDFELVYTAGPSEFLGLIHKADYVITNSFHVTAFSIIYQKKFTVFTHTAAGERISNILRLSGLESRLYEKNGNTEAGEDIDWSKVEKRMEDSAKLGEEFLMKNLNIFG